MAQPAPSTSPRHTPVQRPSALVSRSTDAVRPNDPIRAPWIDELPNTRDDVPPRSYGGQIPCPLTPSGLRRAVLGRKLNATQLADVYDVARDTAARWLADAGLAQPDPLLTPALLHDLYQWRQLSVHRIAAEMRVGNNRVLRALASARIEIRPRSGTRIPSEAVPASDLCRAYLHDRMTIAQLAAHFDVSRYFIQRRIRELDLGKRRGSHSPRSRWTPAQLEARTLELHAENLSIFQIAARLDVSTSTIRDTLHRTRTPITRSNDGRTLNASPPPSLLHRLYSDHTLVAVLRQHSVNVPATDDWTPSSPWHTHAPLPLAQALLADLYDTIGLSTRHIALVCGVSQAHVRTSMHRISIPMRPAGITAPWTRRGADAG